MARGGSLKVIGILEPLCTGRQSMTVIQALLDTPRRYQWPVRRMCTGDYYLDVTVNNILLAHLCPVVPPGLCRWPLAAVLIESGFCVVQFRDNGVRTNTQVLRKSVFRTDGARGVDKEV